MTDAQAALAQVREALAAGPTPGKWFPVNDGTPAEPFMNVKAERISGRGPTHEVAICATGDSPQSMETANARFIAACSPTNIAAILAHVEAQEAENESLTAALQHEADCVEAYRAQAETMIRERNELRRQFDPMGEYASADELIAALHAEKAEDDALKRDARRYRWLRKIAHQNTAYDVYKDGAHWSVGLHSDDHRQTFDQAIDAAMGGGNG